MRVFVGVNFDKEHQTSVVCCEECRSECLRRIEQERGESLHWAPEAIDGPDGGALVEDSRRDVVGVVVAFDVLGSARLRWEIDSESGCLSAPSLYHDDGSPLLYTVHGAIDDWMADIDGRQFARGTLEHCMAECRKSEDAALLEASRAHAGQAEGATLPRDDSGAAVKLLRRMLDPEDLGRAVPRRVRDDVREALGLSRCES